MSTPPPKDNPLLYQAQVSGGSHEYRIEVRRASNGTRYMHIIDTRRARHGEEERRGVIVFEECGPELWWELTRAMAVLSDRTSPCESESQSQSKSGYADSRASSPRAYEPWSESEDARLILAYEQGMTVTAVAHMLERQEGAVTSRLRKLGMLT